MISLFYFDFQFPAVIDRFLLALSILMITLLGGCASLPPGSSFAKLSSSALVNPEQSRLGHQFYSIASQHDNQSGFRIIPAGMDGFALRMQMINAAERTLDLQYFIFRGDKTGRLLTDAVLHAADHGVRVRVLLDDGETMAGDEQIAALAVHPAIEIRIFNPFRYRGHLTIIRAAEFTLNASRLDYRMHNKLLVVDNSIALIGGRNIGDQYFQIDPASQFADDDVFAVGPIVQPLSATFDEYWNSSLAIPVQALSGEPALSTALSNLRVGLDDEYREMKEDNVDPVKSVVTGEPFAGMLAGRLPLIWAHARVVCDSPEKKKVENGAMVGMLMQRAVADAALQSQFEVLMITPYLIPGSEGMQIFNDLRRRNVRVRLLTSSLEASTAPMAQAGYMHYRVPLLQSGVELYEIRSLLGNTKGSGETKAISGYGNYSLHAKLFVFDRRSLFIGSMNFDQRSMHLNTEIGLIIDSPELAQQVATRFNAMVQSVNSYHLQLRRYSQTETTDLQWDTEEGSQEVEYDTEPARDAWQRIEVQMLSLLPMDNEL